MPFVTPPFSGFLPFSRFTAAMQKQLSLSYEAMTSKGTMNTIQSDRSEPDTSPETYLSALDLII